MLKFSPQNAKLKRLNDVKELSRWLKGKRKVYSLDILSGWSCPYADECLSKVHIVAGKKKVKDGINTKFRCFSASQEALFPAVYKNRKHNFDMLKSCKDGSAMVKLLTESLPKNAGIVRIHVAGDFFSQKYFDAWLFVALANPDVLFYAYTKSLPFWQARTHTIPDNFVLTASRGGRKDDLIDKIGFRETVVVFSEKEAEDRNLPIDHDDSHAAIPETRNENFALLIHGTQPAGSEAGKAMKALKGVGSYSNKKRA